MRYDVSMKEWLRERRLTLLLVGVAVPLMIAVSFWNVIRPDWPSWLACYLVGFPAAIAGIWVFQRGGIFWARLKTRQRVLLRCLAVAALWSLLVLSAQNRSHRFLEASATTAAALLLWGVYTVFCHVIDRVLSRVRRR